jgi:hypothetical protein
MYTIENLFHLLHQLAAIIWLGGVLAVNVFQLRLGRRRDRAAQLSLLRLANFYGQAVIAPAAAVVLVTGLILVAQTHVAWSASWVIWGIAGILASLVLGATLIRATNAELTRIAADTAPGNPRWLTLNGRAARLYGINLIVLLSVLWAMVFQPTL